MDSYYWVVFVISVVGASMIPGPSTLIAFAHGTSFGGARSAYTALGNAAASTLQAAAASAGLGIVIINSAPLFTAIQYAGAAYLVYIGIRMWRSAANSVVLEANSNVNESGATRLFLSGFTVAAGNPKAIAFFTAFFPQFLSPGGNSFYQLATMVLLVGVSAFGVALFYGMLGAWVHGLELSKKLMARVYRTTGGLFVASGFMLAWSGNNR